VSFINKEVVTVLDSPNMRSKLAAQEFTPKPTSPDNFRKFIQEETQKFSDLIKTNNLTID
jgi:tripartite-type tricarboxylate transporter receptor subunit TctC